MQRLRYLAILALSLILVTNILLTNQVRAQATSAFGSQASSGTNASDVDPEAIAALNKMGAYLRTLKAFQVRAATSRDEVLADGQKISFDGVVDLLARTPDRLRLEVKSDLQHRLFLYNGKTFTLWAQLINYYATVPAPPTISELADRLDEKFGIQLPLEDLFSWGTPRSRVNDIKAAVDVGPSSVEGITCDQYAFRVEGLDWQVWIQNGDYPLPRKLVLTTLTDEARPVYTSVLTWNLAPSFNDTAFEFEPPKDAQKIVFAATGGEKP